MKVQTSEKIDKLVASLVKAKKEMHGAAKSGKNPRFNGNHFTLEDVRGATEPQLLEHGLVVMQFPIVMDDGSPGIATGLYHESGQYMYAEAAYKPIRGDDVQAQGSCITYGRRYGQVALLNLVEKDDDGEAAVKAQETAKPKETDKPQSKQLTWQQKLENKPNFSDAQTKAALEEWFKSYEKDTGRELTGEEKNNVCLKFRDKKLGDIYDYLKKEAAEAAS